MTITATIHVNGNYECPIVYEQGEARTEGKTRRGNCIYSLFSRS